VRPAPGLVREHERWAREDEARTFEHRCQAYGGFYEAVKALARTAYGHGTASPSLSCQRDGSPTPSPS
jgi:hypothetical protein